MSEEVKKEHEQIGSLTGAAAGVLAGASLGTTLLPVIGTFAGALAGGIMGSEFGRTIGGAILDALNPSVANVDVPNPTSDLVSQLERLGQLRAQGLITQEEFIAAKAKLVGL